MSALTWIAHDRAEHDRINGILAALQLPEARDEMGIGGIRDTLADAMFPGTTTVQTRLKYMLFVPWCYQQAQATTHQPATFASRVDRLERDLIAPLKLAKDAEGIFGAVAGERIKRLPSAIYWSGLHRWGIRREAWSTQQVAQNIGKLKAREDRIQRTDEGEAYGHLGLWHADLPPVPVGFPEGQTFELTAEEASFLKGRITSTDQNSLLAWLAMDNHNLDIGAPWELANLPQDKQDLTEMARILCELIHGAALLYNYLLSCEKHPNQVFVDKIKAARSAELHIWQQKLSTHSVKTWDLAALRQLVRVGDHNVSDPTWGFVEAWRDLVVEGGDLLNSPQAAALIHRRESNLKRSRSRFSNHEMRGAWNGYAGAGRILFRWQTVQTLLHDLRAGLQEQN
jgi:hypothetical protein